MYPKYPLHYPTVIRLALAILTGQRRSFRRDSQVFVGRLDPPLRVEGAEYIPASGPCLLTFNHYARPRFAAWWLAMAVSAALPLDAHWTITAAWTFPGRWYRGLAMPVSRRVLARIARVYGFTPMPAMPPDPAEAAARAAAVRQVLTHARRTPGAVIALAPEGHDRPGGVLGWPSPGAGRFMLHLAQAGLEFVPIGVYEEDGAFCLRFGPHYRLDVPPGLAPDERDRQASRVVMTRIARQLPPHLRGEFG